MMRKLKKEEKEAIKNKVEKYKDQLSVIRKDLFDDLYPKPDAEDFGEFYEELTIDYPYQRKLNCAIKAIELAKSILDDFEI
jgi:hypothetical protein